MHWSWRSENIGIVKKRTFTVSHAVFPFVRGWQSPFQSPVMLHSSFDPLGLTTSSDTLGKEVLSQVPMLRLTPSNGVRTSKLKKSLAWWKMMFSWIDWTGWLYEIACKIMTTWLGSERHQAGYWIDLVNTKALLERNGYREALVNPQRCGSKVDMNQAVHVEKQGFKQRGKASPHQSWRSSKLQG
jgi:hypothetical protein